MDSDILNIEEIVMGGLPDPPPVVVVPPAQSASVFKTPTINFKPPGSSVQPYQHENLQCFQCFITFCNAKAKERHMKKSHREEYKQQLQQGNTLFTCYVCDRSFPSSEELTAHQPTHSKEDKPFKCVYCNESFRIFSELTTHRRQVCPERHFLCKDCNQTFRSHGLLRTHRLAQHPRPDAPDAAADQDPDNPAKTHRCSKCGQGFEEESQLLEHQEKYAAGETCNGNAVRKRGRPPKQTEDASVAPEKKPRRKKKEGETSEEAADSGAATAEAKGKGGGAKRGRPAKAAAAATSSSDKDAPENDDEEEEEEEEDGEASAPPAAAAESKKAGKAAAVPPRLIHCPECKQGCAGAAQLRAHKKEKHPPPRKPHPCEECEESFLRPEQLEAHKARAHTAGRFPCPACGKSFGRERTLKAHQLSSHPEMESQAADDDSQNVKR